LKEKAKMVDLKETSSKKVKNEVQTEAVRHAEVVKIPEGVKVVSVKDSFAKRLWFWLKKRRLRKKKDKLVVTGLSLEEKIERTRNKYESKVDHPMNSGSPFDWFFRQ
jgi:hypothetical protein